MAREQKPVQTSRNLIMVVVAVAVLLIVTIVLILLARFQEAQETIPHSPPISAPQAPVAPVPVPEDSLGAATDGDTVSSNMEEAVDPEKLLGRWQRTDGGYVLELAALLPGGKLKASYFNPRSINIEQASFTRERPPRVFVRFNDQGYEGSTYTLVYDAKEDVLYGQYFQAMMGQTYEVAFVRERK